MDQSVTKIFVSNLQAMLDFYMTHLQADLLDQAETTALLAIDNDLFEFIECYDKVFPTQIAIQYGDYQHFNSVCQRLNRSHIHKHDQDNQITYRTNLKDIEGNDVYLYHHQIFIPDRIEE